MIRRAQGFYEHFVRKDGTKTRSTHYCAGCGHGIIHKLIAEAMAELGIQDESVFISPVGCAVFCYYYFDCGNVGSAHGRVSAVATGLARSLPGKVIIGYQGDGGLGAIGFNNAFQAANRGEHFAMFFVNNALYAMTGGQMAPTTLPGQRTTTTPWGRDVVTTGNPLKVCEVFDQLESPVYIERVSVADTKRIMQARKAIRKALEIQRDGKGYALVEILSPCPTNMHMDPVKAAQFTIDDMEPIFPLGCLRDRSGEPTATPMAIPRSTITEVIGADGNSRDPVIDPDLTEQGLKFSGFGGQGILSLGLIIAKAASASGRFVSWFPSYGPEQRGGSASCSVIIGGRDIGSPIVDSPDVLVAMNQQAFERFVPTVAIDGTVLYDESIPVTVTAPEGVSLIAFPATRLAIEQGGVSKAANTALLGAMTEMGLIDLPEDVVVEMLKDSFAAKPELIPKNMEIFQAAKDWAREHLC